MSHPHEHNSTNRSDGKLAVVPMATPSPPPWMNQKEEEWDLRRFIGIARRRGLVIAGVATIVMLFSIRSALNQQTTYTGNFQLLVEPVNAQNDLSNLTGENTQSSGRAGLDYDTQITVLKSPELLSELVEELQPTYPDISYDALLTRLEVARVRETKILEVRYSGDDPAKIQAILQELSKIYLQYSLDERQTYLRQGIQFVDDQLPELQEKVDSLQDRLQVFRQQNGFIDPDVQADQVASAAATLEQQQAEIDQELTRARSQFQALQGDTGALTALNQSTTYQQLLGQVQQLETEIAIERARFREQNLNIQVIRKKQENLLPLLRQEAERVLGASLAEAATQIQTLEVQRQAIVQARTGVQQEIQQLPVLTREYANLQRELQIATDSLTRFLETRQNLRVDAAQQEIPWQVIREPGQPAAIAADTNRSLMLGLVASLGLGIGAALLLEKLDNTYHSVDDLREKLKMPILGVLPFDSQLATIVNSNVPQRKKRRKSWARTMRNWLKSASKFAQSMKLPSLPLDDYDSSSRFTEALRVLHTNFQMLNTIDRPIRSLVITSAVPGEGKSTLALHWAKTAAAMGQRVLLVDADLRRPQIHSQLNLTNHLGFSNIIVKNLDPDTVIRRASPSEPCYVLTSGQASPDPASLLASRRTRKFVEHLNDRFDLVIYDAPPLLGLADANLLARYVDGLVLLVRLDKTDRPTLKKVVEDLKAFHVPILGLVANGQRGYSSAVREYTFPIDLGEDALSDDPAKAALDEELFNSRPDVENPHQ